MRDCRIGRWDGEVTRWCSESGNSCRFGRASQRALRVSLISTSLSRGQYTIQTSPCPQLDGTDLEPGYPPRDAEPSSLPSNVYKAHASTADFISTYHRHLNNTVSSPSIQLWTDLSIACPSMKVVIARCIALSDLIFSVQRLGNLLHRLHEQKRCCILIFWILSSPVTLLDSILTKGKQTGNVAGTILPGLEDVIMP